MNPEAAEFSSEPIRPLGGSQHPVSSYWFVQSRGLIVNRRGICVSEPVIHCRLLYRLGFPLDIFQSSPNKYLAYVLQFQSHQHSRGIGGQGEGDSGLVSTDFVKQLLCSVLLPRPSEDSQGVREFLLLGRSAFPHHTRLGWKELLQLADGSLASLDRPILARQTGQDIRRSTVAVKKKLQTLKDDLQRRCFNENCAKVGRRIFCGRDVVLAKSDKPVSDLDDGGDWICHAAGNRHP
jgi:hypothetical protein